MPLNSFRLLFLMLVFVTVISNNENDFIVEYFTYKNVGNVVGFSCNTAKDDFSLIKRFSKLGVPAKLNKLSEHVKIQRFAHSDHRKIGVLFDVRCYNLSDIAAVFLEANEFRMFDEIRTWLILGSNISSVLKIVHDESMGYSTDFVVAVPMYHNSSYRFDLYDIFNLWKERGTALKITLIGSWSNKTRITFVWKKSRYESRSNLQGVILRASFFIPQGKSANVTMEDYLQDTTDSTQDTLAKLGNVALMHLKEMFNFRLKCVITSKWEKGDSIGPAVISVSRNESDITGNPTVKNKKRLLLAKFTVNLWPFRTCFMFRSAQPTTVIKINEVLGPLEKDVWFSAIALLLFSTLILILVFHFEYNHTLCSDSMLVIMGAICQQGTNVKMINSSTRIVFFFIILFSFLFYNYYSASIVSIRLNEPIYKINDSLVELTKTNFKLASEKMVYFEFLLNKPDWESQTFITSWKKIPENERWEDSQKGIRLVQAGRYAFHIHPDLGYEFINRWFTNREICELTEVHLQRPAYLNLGLNLNNTFIEMFNIGLIKFIETGLRKRQIIRWKTKKPECLNSVLSVSSVNIYEFIPHLLVLTFGMGLSVILLVFEISVNLRNRLLLR